MADARVEPITADPDEARRQLTQAVRHAQSANTEGVDNESAYLLLYTAVHKAASATLLAAGRRVTSGERGHLVLLQETRRLLGSTHAELMNRLDRARRQLNQISYGGRSISDSELASNPNRGR